MIELLFKLEQDDDWPPVAKEGVYCEEVDNGFKVKVAPFFVGSMSVDDVITVQRDDEGDVISWECVEKSKNSIIWIMIYNEDSVNNVLSCLKEKGCNVERLSQLSYVSIDVPKTCKESDFDKCLNLLDEDDASIVFPSLRH